MGDVLPVRRVLASLLLCSAAACQLGGEANGAAADIIDGRDATAADATGVVALVAVSTRYVVCTGTLVSPRTVVTAAHCVASRAGDLAAYAIVAGSLDPGDPTAPLHTIERVAIHSQFPGPISADPTTLGNDHDLAVLVLAEPVTDVAPVPILQPDLLPQVLVAGHPLTLAGYGADNQDGNLGRGVLRVGEMAVSRWSDAELLAGEGATSDTCYGDSGGFAFAVVDGQRWLVGVTSRASGTATIPCGDGTIFSLAAASISFVESASGADPSLPAGGCQCAGAPQAWWPLATVIAVLVVARRRSARHVL